MTLRINEDTVESAAQDVHQELHWTVITAWTKETFGPKGLLGRETKSEVILRRHLRQALQKFNPSLPETAYDQGIETLEQKSPDKTIARSNRVHGDEKENGLIVDYGNVYQQPEKAYAIYGEGNNGVGAGKTA